MTRFLIAVAIIVVAALATWLLWEHWPRERGEARSAPARSDRGERIIPSEELPGMPSALEPSLKAARAKGAEGLKLWLRQYGRMVSDPRLAGIQLDYVVMIARDDPAEAKRVFAEVRRRVDENSPVYPRLERLARTYE